MDTEGKQISYDVVKRGMLENLTQQKRKSFQVIRLKKFKAMHPVILQKNANRDLRIYAQFNSWWQCHSEVRGYKGKTIAHDVVKIGKIGGSYLTEKKKSLVINLKKFKVILLVNLRLKLK